MSENVAAKVPARDPMKQTRTRNRIIHLVMRGKRSREWAEKWERQRGLEPFKNEPDVSRFDPLTKADWTLAMTTAWILKRTPEAVRAAWAKFACECWDWQRFEAVVPNRYEPGPKEMHHLVGWKPGPRAAPTPESVLAHARGNRDGLVTAPEKAEDELWAALRQGDKLVAYYGEAAEVIPSRMWKALSPFASPKRRGAHDAVFSDAGDLRYSHVTVERDAVLDLWPKKKQFSTGAKRGPKPIERSRVKAQILADLHNGCFDHNAKKEALARHYDTSRDTCKTALAEALSEFELATNTDTKEISAG